MVSTRSKAAQTSLDDFKSSNDATAIKPTARKDLKRKADDNTESATKAMKKRPNPEAKRMKAPFSKNSKPTPQTTEGEYGKDGKKDNAEDEKAAGDHVTINRAPVLELWGACVAKFIRPDLDWAMCISLGSAVSTICAVAKGKAIGTIEPTEKSEEDKRKKQEAADDNEDKIDEEVQVMQFKLKLKDGLALVSRSDKRGKPGNEETLSKKYKGRYEDVKKSFEEALQTWKGHEDDLNEQAFHFYEQFRPGGGGWGKAGALEFRKVDDIVKMKGK